MSRWTRPGWVCALVAVAAGVQAQAPAPTATLRDPTLAPMASPAELGSSDNGASGGAPLGASGTNVVVRNGKPFLVVGSRLVAPGQMVDSYKLERITETEVWLRDAAGVTKLPRYAGVQRRVVSAQCGTPAASVTGKAPTKKKPRVGVTKRRSPKPSTDAGSAPRPIRENDAHDC